MDGFAEIFTLGFADTKTYNPEIYSKSTQQIQYSMPPVPQLANGGVLRKSTLVEAGEYAGASSNPEIVTPQSLMMETIETANAGIISAVQAMGTKIVNAVNSKDTDLYVDGTKMTRKIMSNEKTLSKRQGNALIVGGN